MRWDIQQVIKNIDALPTAVGKDHARLEILSEEFFNAEFAGADRDVWFRLTMNSYDRATGRTKSPQPTS